MQLTPREQEKLLIYVAADVARRRRARGLRLNLPEATALITEAMLEGARDGRSVTEVMALARTVLARGDVMEQVPELLDRGPGGGHLPRRHQARDLSRPDPVSGSAPIGGYQHPDGRHRAQRGSAGDGHRGHEPG